MYDIFFIGNDTDEWKKIKSLYPIAQRVNQLAFSDISKKSFTKMFWVIWGDVALSDNFNLKSYKATKWDNMYAHVFLNGFFKHRRAGVCLFPKNANISNKEFVNRFFLEKKEIDIEASSPKKYDIFKIDSYEDYLKALEESTTELFWCVWPDTDIIDDTLYDLYFEDEFNRSMNHVFKNLCNGIESYVGGILLNSKKLVLSKREIEHRFPIEKKQHDRVVSINRYSKYIINNYDHYKNILENEKSEMFWCIWNNVEIIDESIFDLYFDSKTGEYDYDRSIHHVFKNSCHGDESFINGIFLTPKSLPLSKKEIEYKFLKDKKEHDRLVSVNRYPRYNIDTYQDYVKILQESNQEMFWAIWPEIEVTDDSIFDLYFNPRDGQYDYDRTINHVFRHRFRDETTYNGLMLMSKYCSVGSKEIDFRFIINKKEHEETVSRHKDYDIIFISYNEANADDNYNRLVTRFSNVRRIHGIKGIHQAHIKAAEAATTDMFWVVDGDAVIEDSFNFSYRVTRYERDIVHVWRSRNPNNHLEYGYGGVKLLPRSLTLDMDINSADMTTSISKRFKAMPEVSNITAFNTDPFNTWKSAFRECAKLASAVINRQDSTETNERLDIWCTVANGDYAEYAISGARAGRQYGELYKGDQEALKKINDFDWLKEKFNEQ
jgi:hypothetical protein